MKYILNLNNNHNDREGILENDINKSYSGENFQKIIIHIILIVIMYVKVSKTESEIV
jgi:hypothetical protein